MRKGGAFRLVGLILGITSCVISIVAIVFSVVGLILGKTSRLPKIRR